MTNGPNGYAVDRAHADAARRHVHAERREVWKFHQERLPRRGCSRPDGAGGCTSRGVPPRPFATTRLKGEADPLSQAAAAEGRLELGKRDAGVKIYPVNVIFPRVYGH